MNIVKESDYNHFATLAFEDLQTCIAAHPVLRSHEDEVFEIISLRLMGPWKWNDDQRKVMKKLLDLHPEDTQPLIEEVINKLEAYAIELSNGNMAEISTHRAQLAASFQIKLTWHKIDQTRHKMGLPPRILALGLSAVALVGVGYTLYRVSRLIHGQAPDA